MTTVIAKSKFISGSPRKLRLVANSLKGLSPAAALNQLQAMPQRAAIPLIKTLKQALANAKHNQHLEPKDLSLKNILIDEGRRLKRMDKSHGSHYDRGIIQKRSAHITIILELVVPAQPTVQKRKEASAK